MECLLWAVWVEWVEWVEWECSPVYLDLKIIKNPLNWGFFFVYIFLIVHKLFTMKLLIRIFISLFFLTSTVNAAEFGLAFEWGNLKL